MQLIGWRYALHLLQPTQAELLYSNRQSLGLHDHPHGFIGGHEAQCEPCFHLS
jgi:hypothetical protein